MSTVRAGAPVRWVDLLESDAGLPEALAELDLPDLVVEDILEQPQRPKAERYRGGLFVVADAARYDDAAETVEFHQLRLFLSTDIVVTVRPTELRELDDLHARWEAAPTGDRQSGDLAHQLLDLVVDSYAPVVQGLIRDVSEIEIQVFSPEQPEPSERIYLLKRHVLAFIRHSTPLLGRLNRLHLDGDLVDDDLAERFRDVEDHLEQTVRQLEQLSDMLTTVFDANLSQISVRQNEDMRRMSAWAAMFLLPTLLAGVWGMNFTHMPETDWRFGYPLGLAVMVAASALLYTRLRKAGWL
ncbi:MAG: magnesium and cobalt transport protein CorA [Acidimicrobiia bacterium]